MYRYPQYRIVGWVFNDSIHCPACTRAYFGRWLRYDERPADANGDETAPILWHDMDPDDYCADCLASLKPKS